MKVGFARNQSFSFGGESCAKPGYSVYYPGYSGNVIPETPGLGPETPDLGIRILLVLTRIFRVLQDFGTSGGLGSSIGDRLRFISKFQIILHIFSYHMHTYRRRR